MKYKIKVLKYIWILSAVFLFCLPSVVGAKGIGNGGKRKIAKTSASQNATAPININNINALQQNNGFSDFNPNSNAEGTVFPIGTAKNICFEGGFLWGGFVRGDTAVRVGGSTYNSGLEPGPLGSDGKPADPTDAQWSIYRVRQDVYPGGPSVDLSGDAAAFSFWYPGNTITADQVKAQYLNDWNNWPAKYGAPYTDANGVYHPVGGDTYDPKTCIPGVKGADQTVYYIANDEDPNLTQGLYGALPLGLEVHVTMWAYSQAGALGNMYFKRWQIINKGYQGYTIDSMYVAYWTDVDLGDATDDLVGCDSALSLSYTYNSKPTDAVYDPLPPPSIGFDFFEGPKVTGSPTDTAIFLGKKIGGYKNLPMYSAFTFTNPGSGTYAPWDDPDLGVPQGSRQMYDFMLGLDRNGAPNIDPITGKPSRFVFSGDPVNFTGWVDGGKLPGGVSGISFPGRDVRQGMSAGPFTMAPGDTQEVVVGEICAGATPSVDYHQAITLMESYDVLAQKIYNNFFQIASAPATPIVVGTAQNNKIILDWGENLKNVEKTETSVSPDILDGGDYTFQGYNVYQISPYDGTTKLLATYDIIDSVTSIPEVDRATGQEDPGIYVEFGSNSGIKRYFIDSTDAFNGNKPLNNGTPYYFSVTAYNYNPKGIPRALETPISKITIIPQSNAPGVRYAYGVLDTIKTQHSGPSNGKAFALVINPAILTGDQYKVTFDTTGGATTWSLTDVTTNKVLLSNQTNQTGDINYPSVDGMQVKVVGPAPGMNPGGEGVGWDIPSGTRRFTWAGGADGLGLEGFSGAIGWAAPSTFFGDGIEPVPAADLPNTLLTLAQVTDTSLYNPNFPGASDVNMSYGYRYGRGFANPPAQPQFAPYIVNTAGTGYDFQDFKLDVPLSAWNVDDPAHPVRLAVGFLENNAADGLVDGKYWPPDYSQRDNVAGTGPREWLWIFNAPYSETGNPAFEVEPISNDLPIMWFCTYARRGPVPFSSGSTGEDQFLIYSNHVNSLKDSFTFTATAPTQSDALAKVDVNKINVFPNPYYGANYLEPNKYQKFVTFNHLPSSATIRIFNLAGTQVKVIHHSSGNFEQWSLTNESNLPVASGLYIAYIDMPQLGVTKILKFAVIQGEQIPDRF